jgi:hypothetical protein
LNEAFTELDAKTNRIRDQSVFLKNVPPGRDRVPSKFRGASLDWF